jgi:hypothetical protein
VPVETVLGEDAGMGREHVAGGAAGAHLGLADQQRFLRSAVVFEVLGLRIADHHGAHDRGVVVPIGAREFERDLIPRVEHPPPGLVAAEQGIAAGADDELVAGIIAARTEDRRMLGGQDLALVHARRDERERGIVCRVRERAGLAHVGQLFLGFHGAQARHDEGRIGERREAFESRFQLLAVRGHESIRLVFDADAFALEPDFIRETLQIRGRVRIRGILPDANVADVGGVLRLAQIGRARQQRHAPVGGEHEALEEAEPEGVVAREPVHGFLLEQQQPIEAFAHYRFTERGFAAGEFGFGEVQGHGGLVVRV